MFHDTFVGPPCVVWFFVDQLHIPRCLALPLNLSLALWIYPISQFPTNLANSFVLWMLHMPTISAVAVQRLAMHSSLSMALLHIALKLSRPLLLQALKLSSFTRWSNPTLWRQYVCHQYDQQPCLHWTFSPYWYPALCNSRLGRSQGYRQATYPRDLLYPRWTYQSASLGLTLLPCSSYDRPLPQLPFCGSYLASLTDSGNFSPTHSIPVPVCSTVDNLHSLTPTWLLGEGVDQPVHWCLDTLHRHRLRCKDRPYGGILPKGYQ